MSKGELDKESIRRINATNHRVFTNNSITIGGFHWNDLRMSYATLRYRFHF